MRNILRWLLNCQNSEKLADAAFAVFAASLAIGVFGLVLIGLAFATVAAILAIFR
jgi:hypothetical protein